MDLTSALLVHASVVSLLDCCKSLPACASDPFLCPLILNQEKCHLGYTRPSALLCLNIAQGPSLATYLGHGPP